MDLAEIRGRYGRTMRVTGARTRNFSSVVGDPDAGRATARRSDGCARVGRCGELRDGKAQYGEQGR